MKLNSIVVVHKLTKSHKGVLNRNKFMEFKH